MKYYTFFQKFGKMSPNLSSVAVVFGALRVKTMVGTIVLVRLILFLILFFTSHQQSFSYKGTGLPGLNQY